MASCQSDTVQFSREKPRPILSSATEYVAFVAHLKGTAALVCISRADMYDEY